ncbi:DUF1134 domain-containing protein [bacterium]|nr:DUF1134 domain-containing protein [bacterium]
MKALRIFNLFGLALALNLAAFGAQAQTASTGQVEDFSESAMVVEAAKFLGATAESMAEVMDNVFTQYGEPTAVIRGEEVGAAVVFGLRYGRGDVLFKNGQSHPIYWRGPSAGIDTGGNASKSFTLVYGTDNIEDLYRRIGGVDGSAFYIGGVAVSFLQRDQVVLAPIRVGVGFRAGVSVGYLKFTPQSGWFPF